MTAQPLRHQPLRYVALCFIGIAGACLGTAAVQSVHAAKRPATRAPVDVSSTPEILVTAGNTVPACVTPDRLMVTLNERNPRLPSQFKSIATYYKQHGEKLGIRWDYAFYQMILETNALQFTGDVKVGQNNFAGLGATGGGVRGESFPDVSTGVLAQLQHLVAYSGQVVDKPVAVRTRDNQNDIIAKSKKLGRPVRFADLTNRWAADRNYARSIETTAARFRDPACSGQPVASAAAPAPVAEAAPTPSPVADDTKSKRRRGKDIAKKAIEDGKTETAAASGLGAPRLPAVDNANCSVMAASFGGSVTLLIRAENAGAVTYTALDVEGGSEQSMADSYMKVHAPAGKIAGRFKNRDEAIGHAYTLCDSGKP